MCDTLFDPPVDDSLMDVPIDQFDLSEDAIQAVLDGEGPGFCELDIDLLTAIAVASGVVTEVNGELRRMQRFTFDGQTFTIVGGDRLVPVPVSGLPVGKLRSSN